MKGEKIASISSIEPSGQLRIDFAEVQNNDSARVQPKIDPEILATVFSDSPSVSQNEILQHRDDTEAAIMRAALVRAQQLREAHADPGDAFVEGVTRLLEAEDKQKELDQNLAA